MRVVFLHHSTGGDLIRYGKVRERFRELDPSIEFWDHGYDPSLPRRLLGMVGLGESPWFGLRDASGNRLPYSWHVPNNNTDPDGLAVLFQQPVTTPPTNALSHLLEFDAIVFKSCFPVTAIRDEAMLQGYKTHYLTIRDTIDRYPNRLFIPMTPPPLRASETTPEQAARARRFADWMKSDEFVGGRDNIVVYDFFDALAAAASDSANANTLAPRWCLPDLNDSHPSPAAHAQIAETWVNFIVDALRQTEGAAPVKA